MNEPVLSLSPDENQNNIKYSFYNQIYNTVRSQDPNHIVVFEEFCDWNIAKNRPKRATWTNYMFEKHPYDMPNAYNWYSQKALADSTVSTIEEIQRTWNIPVLTGEFCLYYFSDVWDDFLSGLNRNSISWTNWNVTATNTSQWNPIRNMIDGSTDTLWSSGILQNSGQSITIDFGQTENFYKIELISSGEDYPGSYKVETSYDGVNFTSLDLNNTDIGFGFKMVLLPVSPQSARYIKITLTGNKDKWWAINELNVYWRNVN